MRVILNMIRFILILIIYMFPLNTYAEPSINIGSIQAEYKVGDVISVTVSLSESPKIHGGGVNIEFNPNVFQVQSVNVDSVWNLGSKQGVINNQTGKIDDVLFANFNGVEGELGVATIQMKVVGS